MKIGFLINYFYPFLGGEESNCYYLARELVRKGHEVHIFTTNRKDRKKVKNEEVINGIHVHRSNVWFRYRYYFTFAPGLLLNVFKYKLDILHVHSFGFIYHDLIATLKKLFSKTKLVNTPHGPFMALKDYSKFQILIKNVIEFIEKPVNNRYDLIIQVNPYQEAWLRKKGAKRITFVPNGITKPSFEKIMPAKESGEEIIILYIGRIQKYKGLDQVIRTLPKLNKKIVFVAIGEDAGDKDRLIKLSNKLNVSARVSFTGRVTEEEKLKLLDKSHIFLLPSKWEAFGIVILEAMARGKVIVSTKTEGGKFLVEKENGYLYTFGNIEELHKILEKLTKENLSKYEKINKEKAKRYLWETVVNDLEKAYEKISPS